MRSTLAAMFVLIFDVSWTDYSQILRVIAAFEIVRLFFVCLFSFRQIKSNEFRMVSYKYQRMQSCVYNEKCMKWAYRWWLLLLLLQQDVNYGNESWRTHESPFKFNEWQAVSMHTHTQKGFGSFANPEYFIYSCSMSITSSHAWPSILSGLMVDKWWFYVCAECIRRDHSFAISCIRSLFVVHWTKEQKKTEKQND